MSLFPLIVADELSLTDCCQCCIGVIADWPDGSLQFVNGISYRPLAAHHKELLLCIVLLLLCLG